MNLLKYPRKITKFTNIAYAFWFTIALACFIKYPAKEWWLPLSVLLSYVFMLWGFKKFIWDKRDKKAQRIVDEIESIKPHLGVYGWPRDEVNLQYIPKDYKPVRMSFNTICETKEQFELFSKFLLEFQRIGGKVI